MIIKKFAQSNQNHKAYDVSWKGSSISLNFRDMDIIRFVKPGNLKLEVEVAFKDGRRDVFQLSPAGPMRGMSQFGPWQMEHSAVAKIEFLDDGTRSSFSFSPGGEFDELLLTNGDAISGKIEAAAFTLKTQYGTLTFESEKIQNINFEGDDGKKGSMIGGRKSAVVSLRVGDKVSGVIQEDKIAIHMRSGELLSLDIDKVKEIHFGQPNFHRETLPAGR